MKLSNLLFILFSCLSIHVFSQGVNPNASVKLDTINLSTPDDSLEFELEVFDAAYESYLAERAKPMDFYSQPYYENWNWQYVIAWNENYAQANFVEIIDCYIDYFPNVDYGLVVNYKLYNYFQFVEEKYKIKLIDRY